MRKYYTEQTMESIARRVLDAYDERLYRGQPRAIPIEDLIERHGLILEFQYLLSPQEWPDPGENRF